MRFYHLIFLFVLILVGASLSNTIHKYMTFLPTW
jgi:hypothetical protein